MTTGKSFRNPTTFFFSAWAVLALLFCSTGPAAAGAVGPLLRKTPQANTSADRIPVIIHLKQKAALPILPRIEKKLRRGRIVRTLKEHARADQKNLIAALKQKKAGRLKSLWLVNGIAAEVDRADVDELASFPGVERVVLDAVVHAPEVSASVLQAPGQWNLSAIHADDLWSQGFIGQGVVVANMDTGVDADHPDLFARWRGGANSWYNPYSDPVNAGFCKTAFNCTPCELSAGLPCDFRNDQGIAHGTGTMGIIAGGDTGGTTIGVAPGATWIAAKIFNDAGEGRYSLIHEAFQWLLDPDSDPETDDAPDVVNASWGLVDPAHGCNTEFEADVQALKAAGTAIVFSAGNDGPDKSTSVSPANYSDSFSVGGVDSANTIWNFSSRGPSACGTGVFPHIVAPAVNVTTLDRYDGLPGAYISLQGTSFAAPHVAGGMALLLSAFPGISVPEMEFLLTSSATDLGPADPDLDYGNGLIDLAAAHALFSQIPRASVTINDGAGLTDRRQVVLSFSATDGEGAVTDMRLSWDNVSWFDWEAYTTTRKIWIPAGDDGVKTIFMKVRDMTGNVSAVYSDSIVLDRAAPLGTVLLNGADAATNNRLVTLTLTASDMVSGAEGMRFSWDHVRWSRWKAYTTIRDIWMPTGDDGVRAIFVKFRDAAGNVSAVYSDSILLDRSDPIGTVLINGGDAATNNRLVTLTLTASDVGSGVEDTRYSWDHVTWSTWQKYTTTRDIWMPDGDEGVRTIHVKFRDAAGNVSAVYSDSIMLNRP